MITDEERKHIPAEITLEGEIPVSGQCSPDLRLLLPLPGEEALLREANNPELEKVEKRALGPMSLRQGLVWRSREKHDGNKPRGNQSKYVLHDCGQSAFSSASGITGQYLPTLLFN